GGNGTGGYPPRKNNFGGDKAAPKKSHPPGVKCYICGGQHYANEHKEKTQQLFAAHIIEEGEPSPEEDSPTGAAADEADEGEEPSDNEVAEEEGPEGSSENSDKYVLELYESYGEEDDDSDIVYIRAMNTRFNVPDLDEPMSVVEDDDVPPLEDADNSSHRGGTAGQEALPEGRRPRWHYHPEDGIVNNSDECRICKGYRAHFHQARDAEDATYEVAALREQWLEGERGNLLFRFEGENDGTLVVLIGGMEYHFSGAAKLHAETTMANGAPPSLDGARQDAIPLFNGYAEWRSYFAQGALPQPRLTSTPQEWKDWIEFYSKEFHGVPLEGGTVSLRDVRGPLLALRLNTNFEKGSNERRRTIFKYRLCLLVLFEGHVDNLMEDDVARHLAQCGVTLHQVDDIQPYARHWLSCCLDTCHGFLTDDERAVLSERLAIAASPDASTTLSLEGRAELEAIACEQGTEPPDAAPASRLFSSLDDEQMSLLADPPTVHNLVTASATSGFVPGGFAASRPQQQMYPST
ncbi:hypothetical protein BV22DRAFT_1051849, partial [Leucogyrophana mollusca]